MNRLAVALLASAFLSPMAAKAADIIEPIPVVEAPADYSGWYIRADAGYAFSSETSGSYRYFDAHSGLYGDDFRYSSIEFKDGYSVGGGVGYRWADHFRTDLTADYYNFKVKGSSDCAYSFGYSGCRFNDSSKADLWTVMANAYVDLGYFGAVTPYIGAGVGFANVSYGEMRNEVCAPNCGDAYNYVGIHEGLDSWRFAASLMAGASIDLTQSLALDVGYRYTRVSEGEAFAFDAGDRAAGATGVQGRDNGFNLHAIRAGLRYSFY